MQSFEPLPVRPTGIPRELRRLPIWLPWVQDGEKKKPANWHGEPVDPYKPDAQTSLLEALFIYRAAPVKFGGIAANLSRTPFSSLDGDDVIDLNGNVDSRWAALTEPFGHTYRELSPSGRGEHILIETAAKPERNRRVPGVEIISHGILTVTGHRVSESRTIRSGGRELRKLLDALPPQPTLATDDFTLKDSANPELCQLVLRGALINARFRRLWAGDWRDYASQSEADAALAMHLARNGADLATIVALLRRSKLARPKLRRDDYVVRTALFVLATFAENKTAPIRHRREIQIPEDDAFGDALRRVRFHPRLRHIDLTLARLAVLLSERALAGVGPDADGFFTVAALDLVAPGCSRMTAWRHLQKAVECGALEMAHGKEYRSWQGSAGMPASALVDVTRLRVRAECSDPAGILASFLAGVPPDSTRAPPAPV